MKRPIYVEHCDCTPVDVARTTCKNDGEAAWFFREHMVAWYNNGLLDGPRYWSVHGPDGRHVVGVR